VSIITKEVEVELKGISIKYYENLGYTIPRRKDKKGRMTVPKGSKIIVKVKDLPRGSTYLVDVECDCCGKNIFQTNYQSVKKILNKYNNKYFCLNCVMKLFGGKNLQKTLLNKNGISLYQWCIENNRQDILNLWDYELNKCKPSEICYTTNKKYYFKCYRNLHDSFLVNINSLTNKGSTVFCLLCNSFAQWGVDNLGKDFLKKYWDYKKNTVDPWRIRYGNHDSIIYLNCEIHGSYKTTCNNATRCLCRCPECVRERDESFLQEKIRLYISNNLKYKLLHEYNCSIIAQNPKIKNKKGQMPYDNEILELKLIIETHGEQHYKITGFTILQSKHKNTTPEQELHYQKVKDRYKRMYAKSQGYYYLEIPYFTDNKNETWKKLINDKINEILNIH